MRILYACAYVTDNNDLYTELPKSETALKNWLKEMEEFNYKAVVFKIEIPEDAQAAKIDDDYT